MKKNDNKKKYDFPKIFKIIYLFLGFSAFALFFFYTPKQEYNFGYNISKTLASKVFLNKISDVIIPYTPDYRCGGKVVDKYRHVQCWSKYYRKPAVLYPKVELNDVYSVNFSAPEPQVWDRNSDLRKKFQMILSIILFGASIFCLWRFRDKLFNSLISFYKKI